MRATIGLARLIRDRQPRLYDWLFPLRNKRKATEQLDLVGHEPVLHTSRMYPSETGCTTLVMPMIGEPGNNSVLVYDLRQDPSPFMDLDREELRGRLFTRSEDLPGGVERLLVKPVEINKCPALAPRKTLAGLIDERIAINLDACARHWERLSTNKGFIQQVAQAYSSREFSPAGDVDLALYDGFLNDADRPLLARVRGASPLELAQTRFDFHDQRLPELLFRYRARNWPETLSGEEVQRWDQFRHHRLRDADGGAVLRWRNTTSGLLCYGIEREGDTPAQRILDAIDEWATMSEYAKYLVGPHCLRAWSSAFRSSGDIQRARYSSIMTRWMACPEITLSISVSSSRMTETSLGHL